MAEFFALIKFLAACGMIGVISISVLLSLPKSKLRGLVLEVGGMVMMVLSGIYVVSPVSLIPFCPLDEMGAVGVGIASYMANKSGKKERIVFEEIEELELAKRRRDLGDTKPEYEVDDEQSHC